MTQEYYGSKIVTAWPQDKDGHEGYAVKYNDGYISWSPKAIFEEANIALGNVNTLPAFHQRLIAEKAQLEKRTIDLGDYLDKIVHGTLPQPSDEQHALLQEQVELMKQCLAVLNKRLVLLG